MKTEIKYEIAIKITTISLLMVVCSCDVEKEVHNPIMEKQKIKASQLYSIDLKKFYGRPLSYLLDTIVSQYDEVFPIDEPPGYLCGCVFKFSNDTTLRVWFDSIAFQSKKNFKGDWNVKLFPKELVFRIGLHIKGMPYKMQYFGPPPLPIEERLKMRKLYLH